MHVNYSGVDKWGLRGMPLATYLCGFIKPQPHYLITYIVTELHARGCRVLVCLWKPFHGCWVCFSRVMDIQSSIIKGFVNFRCSYIMCEIIECNIRHSVNFNTSIQMKMTRIGMFITKLHNLITIITIITTLQ